MSKGPESQEAEFRRREQSLRQDAERTLYNIQINFYNAILKANSILRKWRLDDNQELDLTQRKNLVRNNYKQFSQAVKEIGFTRHQNIDEEKILSKFGFPEDQMYERLQNEIMMEQIREDARRIDEDQRRKQLQDKQIAEEQRRENLRQDRRAEDRKRENLQQDHRAEDQRREQMEADRRAEDRRREQMEADRRAEDQRREQMEANRRAEDRRREQMEADRRAEERRRERY